MPALRLPLLLAAAAAVLVALSPVPVHASALAPDRAQVARHAHVRGHDAIARRKRSDTSSPSASGRCIPRPSSSLVPTAAPSPTPTPTPTPSPTSSAAPVATSAASASSGGKKWGLAWGADNQYLSNFALPNVGFLYTWSPSIPSNLPSGVQGIPMLWGYNQVDEFKSTVVQGYASHVLGMNEPNEPSQSNMSPQDAISLWMQYINPLASQGYYLISPACTDDDIGKSWYQQFFAICNSTPGCHVDAIAFHAYTTSADDLINYANMLHDTYNMDIWITEFADQNFSGVGGQASMSQVWDFAGKVVDFVNNTPWLAAAFPFGIMNDLQGVNTDNSLLTGDGQPTSLAYYYLG